MVATPLSHQSRARGALLGLAAGNALGVPAERLGTPEAIAQQFPAGLTDIIRQDTPASPYDDDTAMALILAEELLQPAVDLERLVHRWIAWMESDGRGIGEWTRTALRQLAAHGTPPETSPGASNGAIMRCLPVALATYRSPRNLVSGTYHTAALTHPHPYSTWGAVAVNVAAASFLRGRNDFIPEVIEALRTNEAPEPLLASIRRIPLERREALPVLTRPQGEALQCVEIALWFAYHEPRLERGLIWLANAGGDTDTNAAVAGGLMGARDGEGAVPPRWLAQLPGVETIKSLATRLVGPALEAAAEQ